jgi:hypothetical protein
VRRILVVEYMLYRAIVTDLQERHHPVVVVRVGGVWLLAAYPGVRRRRCDDCVTPTPYTVTAA